MGSEGNRAKQPVYGALFAHSPEPETKSFQLNCLLKQIRSQKATQQQ